MIKKIRKPFEYTIIAILACVMALNYEIFIFQNSFAPAGINGLATMVQYLFDFSVGYMSLIINIPLVIIAILFVHRDFALKSGLFVLVFSGMLIVFDHIDLSAFVYHTENGTSTILAPIAAGVINGAIYGISIRMGGSTGGTDVVAAIIRTKRPHISLVWIIFALNVSVAAISYFVYGFNAEPVILCIVYCFLTSTVSDHMLKGLKEAIKFEVITDKAPEISQRLMTELHHGVTVINAEGMYSHTGKQVIICVINKHQIVDFQKIVKEYPGTFAYVTGVNETVGNFKKISK
ncbi:MAG: YitT family protein [Clostridia bacterium]|nr:YitT family protein [Clostridia bacterium]